MGTVTVLPIGETTMTLGQATDRFLRRDAFEPSTRLAYQRTLQIVLDEFDGQRPVTAITSDDLDDLLAGRWGKAAATEARKIRQRTEDEHRERPNTPGDGRAAVAATRDTRPGPAAVAPGLRNLGPRPGTA